MPLHKEVACLKEICIDNFAQTVVFQGERFRKRKSEGKIFGAYKVIQRFFTDSIVDKVLLVLSQGDEQDEKLKEFIRAFFYGEKLGDLSDWPCLDFLFNEHTTCISLSKTNAPQIPEECFSYIASQCKNLQSATEAFGQMAGRNVCEEISKFQCIQDVDIDFADAGDILKVLEMCPLITNLSSLGASCPDELLLSLCSHRSQSYEFLFCPEDGNCSKVGKHLQVLRMLRIKSHDYGLACALQHLPRLQKFLKTRGNDSVVYEEYLPSGIRVLQDSAKKNGKPFVLLELNALYVVDCTFDFSEMTKILLSCPKLECIQMILEVDPQVFLMSPFKTVKELLLACLQNENLCSAELKLFFAVLGKNIRVLSLFLSSKSVDITYINNIIEACCNLKELYFSNIELTKENSGTRRSVPATIANLEKISIHYDDSFTEYHLPLSPRSYYYELLSAAKSVKFVALSAVMVEQEFLFAMEENDFSSLEELYISQSEVGKMCLEKLMNQKNSLKKVVFNGSEEDFPHSEQLRMTALQKNYELEISFSQLKWFF